jgi:hypothetical protein
VTATYHPISDKVPKADALVALRDALKDVKDGDVLVINAHASSRGFDIGAMVDVNGKKRRPSVAWEDIWKASGITSPPRPAAVLLAACMQPNGHNVLDRSDIYRLKKILNPKILVAPETTYGVVNLPRAKKILEHVCDYFDGTITGGELHEAVREGAAKQFDVTYGCNGWNHRPDCNCRFGPRANQ